MATKLTNLQLQDMRKYAGGDQRATASQVAALKTQALTTAKNIADAKEAARVKKINDIQETNRIASLNKTQSKPAPVAKTTTPQQISAVKPLPYNKTSVSKPLFGMKMAKGGVTASKMGSVKTASPSRDGIASKGKTKGKNLGNSGKNVGIMRGARRAK